MDSVTRTSVGRKAEVALPFRLRCWKLLLYNHTYSIGTNNDNTQSEANMLFGILAVIEADIRTLYYCSQR